MSTAMNVKKKKQALKEVENSHAITLLHGDLHKEIRDLCKEVMDKAKQVFGIAQSMVDSEGKINLQNGASLANLLAPFIRVSHLVKSSNMEVMYKELETILLNNGAEKTNDK